MEDESIALTSGELKLIQDLLDRAMRMEIKKPNTDYSYIQVLAEITEKIDTLRRTEWNSEKFSEWQDIASSFCPDDIPF